MVTWDSAASSKISMEHIFVSTLYKKNKLKEKKIVNSQQKILPIKEKKREIVILYADLAYEWCDLTKKDFSFINLFN